MKINMQGTFNFWTVGILLFQFFIIALNIYNRDVTAIIFSTILLAVWLLLWFSVVKKLANKDVGCTNGRREVKKRNN